MKIESSEIRKITYLDGLRGVAALVVFMAHLIIAIFPAIITFSSSEIHSSLDTTIGRFPLGFLWNGNFAVCVFFVLSGFVISDFSMNTRLSFGAQVFRRYLRLALPMLITSGFAWLLLKLALYKNYDAAVYVTKSGWLSMWYRFEPNFTEMVTESLYRAFAVGHAVYNSNLWTMSLELMGSIYIFLLFALFANKSLRGVVVLIFIWMTPTSYYSLFGGGALLYDHFLGIRDELKRLVPSDKIREAGLVTLFCFGLILGSFPELPPDLPAPWHSWISTSRNATLWHMIGAIVVMSAIMQSVLVQRIFSSKVAVFLGRISFVLYLVHLPLICSLTAWIMLATQGMPYWVSGLSAIIITGVVAMFFSFVLYRYIDTATTSFSRLAGKRFDAWFLPVKSDW